MLYLSLSLHIYIYIYIYIHPDEDGRGREGALVGPKEHGPDVAGGVGRVERVGEARQVGLRDVTPIYTYIYIYIERERDI